MISIPVLKKNIMEFVRLWSVVTVVLLVSLVFLIGTYAPDGKALIMETAFGDGITDHSLNGILGTCFFEWILSLLPFVYVILAAAELAAGGLESGELSWIMSAPTKRKRILFTQIYFLGISLFSMFFLTAVTGLICGFLLHPQHFEAAGFILLCLGGFCLHFCLGGAAMLISCLGSDKAVAVVTAAGVPAFFFVLRQLAKIGGIFSYLNYTTVFSLYRADDVLDGGIFFAWKYPFLLLTGVILYWVSMQIFEKRDLPL